MISLDTFSGICNSDDELSAKMCVPTQTKDVNVQVFSMITSRNEVKAMVKHISLTENANSIVQHVNQIKNEIIIGVSVSVKIIISAKIV